jgi:hypothetical protein
MIAKLLVQKGLCLTYTKKDAFGWVAFGRVRKPKRHASFFAERFQKTRSAYRKPTC